MAGRGSKKPKSLQDRIWDILRGSRARIPKHIKWDVVSTIMHGVSSPSHLGIVKPIALEGKRIENILDAVNFSVNEWYSPDELKDLEVHEPERFSDVGAWEKEIDDDFRIKVWENAFVNVMKRGQWYVLVVGDDATEQKKTRKLLENTGYSIVSCVFDESIPSIDKLKEEKSVVVVASATHSLDKVKRLHSLLGAKYGGRYRDACFAATLRKDMLEEGSMHMAVLNSARIPVILVDNPATIDDVVTRIDGIVEEAVRAPLMPDTGEDTKKPHIFPIMGPTCAGKSEIVWRAWQKMKNTQIGRKASTRIKRHRGEAELEPYQAGDTGMIYPIHWKKAGESYGLRHDGFLPFENGKDLMIPITEHAILNNMREYAEARYVARQVLAPVMITAGPEIINARFTAREAERQNGDSDEDSEHSSERVAERIKGISDEVKVYDNPDLKKQFYSIIINNSSFHTTKELLQGEGTIYEDLNNVVNRLQRFIERTRSVPVDGMTVAEYHRRFVDDTFGLLGFGSGSIEETVEASVSRKFELKFEKDFVREYVIDRNLPVEYMEYGMSRDVAGIWVSNGRAVVLLRPCGMEKKINIDPDQELFTALIERKLGSAWRKQDTQREVPVGESAYGLVKCPDMQFKGGMHFALTDEFPFERGNHIYAIDIVYAEGGDPASVESLNSDDIARMRADMKGQINRRINDIYLL